MQYKRKHRWLTILIWSVILTLTLVIQTEALLVPPLVNPKIHQIYIKSFMAAEQSSLPAIPESDSENDELGRYVRARRQVVQPPPPGWIPNGTAHAQPSAAAVQTPSYVSAPTVTAAAQATPYGTGLPPGLVHRGAVGFSVDPKMLERPGSYDGEIQSWRTWKVKFITYMKALHVEFGTYLYQAEKKTTSIEDFDVPLTLQQHEVYLMSQLVALMNGQCLELVMSADNGFEAWRRLCEDRNRWTVGTKLMKIEQLLDPPLDSTSVLRFRETWQT